VSDTSESPKGYRFPKLVIGHAVYLYHRLPISYRDVQELLFKRGIDVSNETVRAWCVKFGSDMAEALRQRKPKRGRVWHLDEMRIVMSGMTHWLWRAVNEHGEVLDVLLQKTRCKQAAKRCLQRLLDEQDIPEQVVTDGLRSYGAAIREMPELNCALHVRVSAAERQNNRIEQSHRPTRDRERQQRGFRGLERAQDFLFTHAEVGNLFRHTRARTTALLLRHNWRQGFSLWDELSLSIP
jgi:putative transposase